MNSTLQDLEVKIVALESRFEGLVNRVRAVRLIVSLIILKDLLLALDQACRIPYF